ncbi:hypothetical protein HDU88_008112 [Geranomyces variabilis]|nr:hypothetical protein HDU88_008112 [Geranomyces variabilis]
MTARKTLGNLLLVLALVGVILLTLAILGGLPLPLLRLLAWVRAKRYEAGIWGYCPVLADNTPSPTRFCNAVQRPCLREADKANDKSSIIWHITLHIAAWVLILLALMQSFLHRPAMTPAIFAGVGAIVLIIAIYLANTFAECTIDLILHDEKDTTARRGANIYIAGTAAGLALLGAAAFYMEHRFVQKLHAVVVGMGMGTGMATGMATIMGMRMGMVMIMIMDTNTDMGMITDTDMDTDIEGGKTVGKETTVKVTDHSYRLPHPLAKRFHKEHGKKPARKDEPRYAAPDYGPRYRALDGPDCTVHDKGTFNCLDGRTKVYVDEDELHFEDPGHLLSGPARLLFKTRAPIHTPNHVNYRHFPTNVASDSNVTRVGVAERVALTPPSAMC